MKKPPIDVVVSRSFAHPITRVYDAWLTSDIAARFLFATEGGTLLHAEIDGREGGTFRFTERRTRDDGTTWDADHTGVVLRAVRPHTIVLSFCAGIAPVTYRADEATTISITLAAEGNGTHLVLRHEGVPIEHGAKAERGWTLIVDGLERALA